MSDYFQKLIKANQSDTELITGLLLLRHASWLHVFEASQANIRKLTKEISNHASLFEKIRILNYEEELHGRGFPVWAHKQIDSKNSKELMDDRMFDENNLCETIADVCQHVAQIGKGLLTVNGVSFSFVCYVCG